MASKHASLADIPAAGAQYTGVWYVLRLSILAPDGNTRLPMNVLPKNGSYRPITAGKGPSVPEGARRECCYKCSARSVASGEAC